MASIFISYSRNDRGVAEALRDRLRSAGFAAVFLDADPDQGIAGGSRWEQALYAELGKADAVVFLASAASVASRWCHAELSHARQARIPVIPARLVAGAQHPLLTDTQWIDFAERHDQSYQQLIDALVRQGVDPRDAFAWEATRSPYPGLQAFSERDAAVFFGRDRELERLLSLLNPPLARGAGRLVAVVGPSGSGKSSLVRAGLVPRLRKQPHHWVVMPPMKPGSRPLTELAESLVMAFAICGQPRGFQDLQRRLTHDPLALVALARELCTLQAVRDRLEERPAAVLIVLDQAEELVTRTGTEELGAFLQLLAAASQEDSPLWTVATVRSEFLGGILQHAEISQILSQSLLVGALPRSRLFEVIERPARRAGLRFTPGLVGRMVEDTAGGDALPLLAYTLRQLYERSLQQPDEPITGELYEMIGGVVGGLRTQADAVSAQLDRAGAGDLVLPALTKLALVDDGEPARRRVPLSALTAAEQQVVQAFIDARLA